MRVSLTATHFPTSSTDHQHPPDRIQDFLSAPVINMPQTQVKTLGGLTPGAYEAGAFGHALRELQLIRNELQSASPSFAFFSQQ